MTLTSSDALPELERVVLELRQLGAAAAALELVVDRGVVDEDVDAAEAARAPRRAARSATSASVMSAPMARAPRPLAPRARAASAAHAAVVEIGDHDARAGVGERAAVLAPEQPERAGHDRDLARRARRRSRRVIAPAPASGLHVEVARLAEHRLDRLAAQRAARRRRSSTRLARIGQHLACRPRACASTSASVCAKRQVVEAAPEDAAPDQLLLHERLHLERVAAPSASKVTSVRQSKPTHAREGACPSSRGERVVAVAQLRALRVRGARARRLSRSSVDASPWPPRATAPRRRTS